MVCRCLTMPLAAGQVHVGQMGQSRGLELAPRRFSWDAEGEKRLQEVLFQVFIKGASGFHLRGGTVCQFIFQILLLILSHSFSLSPLYIFWVHLLQDCYPLFYFHREMMGKSMNQFWRTSDYLKPRVCSTKVKQRNQRIQNTLTL